MIRILAAILTAASLLACPVTALAVKEAAKAGTFSALEAQEMLLPGAKNTFLVDVRTRAEYTLLGHPPQAYNVPWRFATTDFQVKDGPYQGSAAAVTGYQLSARPNPDFLQVMQSLFKPEVELIIISSFGDQGAEAADVLVGAGFKHVFNIRYGFWGDALAHPEQAKLAEKLSPYFGLRGRVNGWAFWGLPMTHTVEPRLVYPPDIKRMQGLK